MFQTWKNGEKYKILNEKLTEKISLCIKSALYIVTLGLVYRIGTTTL